MGQAVYGDDVPASKEETEYGDLGEASSDRSQFEDDSRQVQHYQAKYGPEPFVEISRRKEQQEDSFARIFYIAE